MLCCVERFYMRVPRALAQKDLRFCFAVKIAAASYAQLVFQRFHAKILGALPVMVACKRFHTIKALLNNLIKEPKAVLQIVSGMR